MGMSTTNLPEKRRSSSKNLALAEIRIDESARSREDHCGAVAGADVFKLGALAADFDSSIGPDEASNRVLIAVGFNEDKVSLQPFFRRNFLDQATVKRHIVCLRILPSSGRLYAPKTGLARPRGLEPPTFCSGGRRSIH